MRYYRVNEDWLTYLEGDFRSEVLTVLRGLPLQRLQKYPPPKITGLPFGNETRVLRRYLKGESSQLDASVLSAAYRRSASESDRRLYDAFRQNKRLSRKQWSEIIGAENVEKWIGKKFLRETEDGQVVSRFCIVGLDNMVLMVDPLNDHGNPMETAALPEDFKANGDDPNIQPFHHTYIGLDSLRQIEVMQDNELPKSGRFLDCGQGAGAILLYFGRRFDEAIGIDINPRAVKLAQFNAELNGLGNCRVYEDSALDLGERYGRFDLVSWNLPFIFMPPEEGENAIDAFGGDMGIGLCLDFIDRLPELLLPNGLACIAAISPILHSGKNVLEERLKEKLARLGLDCTVHVSQIYIAHNRELWQFHESFGIRKFESVYLYFKHGKGNLERVEAPVARKVLDAFRVKLYQRKYAENA